jgi:hypothetical protein
MPYMRGVAKDLKMKQNARRLGSGWCGWAEMVDFKRFFRMLNKFGPLQLRRVRQLAAPAGKKTFTIPKATVAIYKREIGAVKKLLAEAGLA